MFDHFLYSNNYFLGQGGCPCSRVPGPILMFDQLFALKMLRHFIKPIRIALSQVFNVYLHDLIFLLNIDAFKQSAPVEPLSVLQARLY